MKIYLFLSDFRSFVRNYAFSSESNTHPCFYFETLEKIYFYKPIETVLYCCELDKSTIPQDINVDSLKQEFKAIELPEQIKETKTIQVNGVISE